MARPNIILTNEQRECVISCREGFRYEPYIPKKRTFTKESTKAIFINRLTPCFITGEIEFTGEVLKSTADCLLEMHRDCETIELQGQYGEVLGVELTLSSVKHYCSYSDVKGKFTVLCEETPPQPQCLQNN